jgi:putative transposase
MADYQRFFLKGGTYFFTVVTYNRLPIFGEATAIALLKNCFQTIMLSYPFRIEAIVILPDHLHTIWTLPDVEFDFSIRWRLIKSKKDASGKDDFGNGSTAVLRVC